MPSPKKDRATSKEMDQVSCEAHGGFWLGGQCVMEAMVTLRVFKGSPCQGAFITGKASNPAQLRTLATIGLKNR